MNQGGEPLRMRKLFGTDGIRGVAGEFPLDQATAAALGVALARWIRDERLHPEVVIGMDTRESSPWIAEHVAGGLAHEGVGAQFAGLIYDAGAGACGQGRAVCGGSDDFGVAQSVSRQRDQDDRSFRLQAAG